MRVFWENQPLAGSVSPVSEGCAAGDGARLCPKDQPQRPGRETNLGISGASPRPRAAAGFAAEHSRAPPQLTEFIRAGRFPIVGWGMPDLKAVIPT